jgi:hypothetical protein
MPFLPARAAVLLLGCLMVQAVAGQPPPPDDWAARSRALADQLTGELKSELGAAMAAGGPVAAIEVCRTRAPLIAAQLSSTSGAEVRRTALRVRNPANAPDDYERAVLARFARDLEQASPPRVQPPDLQIEWPNLATGGVDRFYLRAIVMQPQCLPCHGAILAPEIADAIRQNYPADAATGFEPGQLRGAIVVRWPAGR